MQINNYLNVIHRHTSNNGLLIFISGVEREAKGPELMPRPKDYMNCASFLLVPRCWLHINVSPIPAFAVVHYTNSFVVLWPNTTFMSRREGTSIVCHSCFNRMGFSV